MLKKLSIISLICIAFTLVLQNVTMAARGILDEPFQAVEFNHTDAQDWINSDPLSIKDLQGKVVLIDFWTFDCWNCYKSFPWMNAMEQRLSQEKFQIIGVHTPEFAHEKIRENIVNKVKQFKLHHPIMIDNDQSYWRAMNNRYWPAFYLIDKNGKVRATFVGETHEGDLRAQQIEATIKKLLNESS